MPEFVYPMVAHQTFHDTIVQLFEPRGPPPNVPGNHKNGQIPTYISAEIPQDVQHANLDKILLGWDPSEESDNTASHTKSKIVWI
jgi:hypothetical protein